MGQVTNVILCHWELDEHAVVAELNLALMRGDESGRFVVPPAEGRWYGGTKALTTSLLIGAFNHLNLTTLRAAIEAKQWRAPDYVQLFVKGHEDDKFRDVPLTIAGSVGDA